MNIQDSNPSTNNISDRDLLVSHNQFVRNDDDDERNYHKWEIRMARSYYDKLYKEFALIDLSGYKEGRFGMRWRTQTEVMNSKGQYICGSISCEQNSDLHSYEVPFKYIENSETKAELVKVRLCEECAHKLYKKKLKEAKKLSDANRKRSIASSREGDETNEVEIVERSKKVVTADRYIDLSADNR